MWATSWPSGEFGGVEPIDGGPWCPFRTPDRREIVIKDAIADAFLQQILLRPAEYDVIATCNLNGDYISDALAAQVGGIGIAPGPTSPTSTKARRQRRGFFLPIDPS